MGLFTLLSKKKQKKVFHFALSKIDHKAKEKLQTSLKNVNKDNAAAILLSINTNLPNSRHSLVYADQIGEMMRIKAKDCGSIPLVTYAEDLCLGVGFHLLMYGSTVLSNEASFLGNIGFSASPWNLKDFS